MAAAATTIKIAESEPSSWPPRPIDISPAAYALDPGPIWKRIESFVSYRWGSRTITFFAEGPGHWVAPLAPTTISTTEVWEQGDGWVACTLDASPLGGYFLPGEGPYRLTGTVGAAGAPPEAVVEAYVRLAEYLVDAPRGMSRQVTKSETSFGGDLTRSNERPATWAARAMIYSGAADLLRPWRRA